MNTSLTSKNTSMSTSETTFFCPECDYEAKQRYLLRLHMEKKHEGKSYQCEYCEMKSGYKHIVMNHKRKKHPEELKQSMMARGNKL